MLYRDETANPHKLKSTVNELDFASIPAKFFNLANEEIAVSDCYR